VKAYVEQRVDRSDEKRCDGADNGNTSFEAAFPLPSAIVGKPLMEIQVQLEHTLRALGDHAISASPSAPSKFADSVRTAETVCPFEPIYTFCQDRYREYSAKIRTILSFLCTGSYFSLQWQVFSCPEAQPQGFWVVCRVRMGISAPKELSTPLA
jgi:hypothetical protein